jgi:hypothetical protein
MATNTSYINGGSGAGEYSTIAAWEAALDGTSLAADTERLEISVVGSEAGALAISGWAARTGSAEIQIEWLGAAFHGGDVNATSANAYVIEQIKVNDGGVRLTGCFADKALGTGIDACFWQGSGGDGNPILFVNCIANLNGETGTAFLGNVGGTSSCTALNCVALNGKKVAASDSSGFASEVVAYNSIAINCGRGMNGVTYYNCLALGCVQDARSCTTNYCIWNTTNGTIVENFPVSSSGLIVDVDTPAANTVLVGDLTSGSEDLIPVEFGDTTTYSNIAIEAGADYSGTFSELANDITGQARGASPTIGAYEVAASGSTPGAFLSGGSGSLTTAPAITRKGIFQATGAGVLTALASITRAGSAAGAGLGTLTGQGTIVRSGRFTAGGAGTLSAIATITRSGALVADGAGTLTAVATVGGTIAGVFQAGGVGGLTALASITRAGSAAGAGLGTLTGQGSIVRSGRFTAGGAGSLSAIATITRAGALVADGAGTLTAVATVAGTIPGVFQAGGIGGLTALATITRVASAGAAGAGALSAPGAIVREGLAAADGAGVLSAPGSIVRSGRFVSGGVSTFAAKATIIRMGVFSASGLGSLAAVSGSKVEISGVSQDNRQISIDVSAPILSIEIPDRIVSVI